MTRKWRAYRVLQKTRFLAHVLLGLLHTDAVARLVRDGQAGRVQVGLAPRPPPCSAPAIRHGPDAKGRPCRLRHVACQQHGTNPVGFVVMRMGPPERPSTAGVGWVVPGWSRPSPQTGIGQGCTGNGFARKARPMGSAFEAVWMALTISSPALNDMHAAIAPLGSALSRSETSQTAKDRAEGRPDDRRRVLPEQRQAARNQGFDRPLARILYAVEALVDAGEAGVELLKVCEVVIPGELLRGARRGP